MGILDKVDVISSVSGGSIIAAYYALHKDNYEEFETSCRRKLRWGVLHLSILNLVVLIVAVVLLTIRYYLPGLVFSFVSVILLWNVLLPVSWLIRQQYNWLFFHYKKLNDLPVSPVVSINATDFQYVEQFKFSRNEVSCYSYGKDAFYSKGFPIAHAVMASSCVPFAFNPVTIPKKFITGNMKGQKSPLLLDGGLYDNQGTHVLTSSNGNYSCDYIIVSDAGNGDVSSSYPLNPLVTLVRTSEVFMQRIKKFQRMQNLYLHTFPDKRFAYSVLEWNVNDEMLQGFIRNILAGHVYPDILSAHGITVEEVARLKNKDSQKEAMEQIMNKLKDNIRWEELQQTAPTPPEHQKAFITATNLIGLRKNKINLLAKEAEWKTKVQVRLYLPFLLK